MTLKEAWSLVLAAEVALFVDDELYFDGDVFELEKILTDNHLWDLELEGFSTWCGKLRIRIYHK